MSLLADLHNHSCLSPCGSLDLSPGVLAALAGEKGIKALALTDHNSALNCPAFAKHCARLGIVPIFGLEATTQEEIHVLCLFTCLEAALSFGEYVYSILTPFPNDPEKTGDQVYVDEDDNIEGEVEYFLSNAIDLSIDRLGPRAEEYGGLVIPAHIDRPAFSMTSQFGVVVQGPWTAVECTRIPPRFFLPSGDGALIDTLGYPRITSSDAHYPEHVARRPFELDAVLEELLPGGPGTEADIEVLKAALLRRPAG
ncbi:MAG: PHP domain-containing protein [Spirochaetaceae bacterium]|jgi:PHP family Zn ribbon phosphoesterase|nr:PHP domain-containing protein [Spirochaetaceae bacterium]